MAQDELSPYKKACRFLCDHLVVLAVMFHNLKDGKPDGEQVVEACSGFVIEFGEKWCFVTAGHVFEKYLTSQQSGAIRVNHWILCDYFGTKPTVKKGTFIDLPSAPRLGLHRSDLGLDFAFFVLGHMYRAGLEANGIRPITRANWNSAIDKSFVRYAIVGVPDALSEPSGRDASGELGKVIRPVFVQVDEVDELPDDIEPPADGWFIGKTNAPFSVSGMSGGPIFGFYQADDGRCFYHAVAVQSGEFPKHQIILGCPIRVFMGLAEYLVEEEIKKMIEETKKQ